MEPVKPKKSLVEETYDILIDAICSGELSPGARINQDEIAARLKVSRQPVNSAISLLKANGLVEDTGRRSVIVTSFDPDLFRSIYEYRMVIEPFAVRLAGKSISDSDRDYAAQVLRAGEAALKSGDLKELLQADMLFHEMIYDWSGNHVIRASMRTNWHHIRRSMAEVLRNPNAVMPVWEEHSDIVDKLLVGQVDEAAANMANHIEKAYKAVISAITHGKPKT